MSRFKRILGFKSIGSSPFFFNQFIRVILMLLVFILLPTLNNLQLANTLTLTKQQAVVEIPSFSPSPSLYQKKSLQNNSDNKVLNVSQNKPKVEVGSKSVSTACKDVAEPWKLVPSSQQEGQYLICNAGKSESMATASELNSAQNNYRVTHNLNALSINADLCKVALERAKEISSNFSHDGFEAAIDRNNINKNAVGENIASGPLTATQFVEWGWDKSPGHRENMLRDWSEGCGGVYDRFAVFLFAK